MADDERVSIYKDFETPNSVFLRTLIETPLQTKLYGENVEPERTAHFISDWTHGEAVAKTRRRRRRRR